MLGPNVPISSLIDPQAGEKDFSVKNGDTKEKVRSVAGEVPAAAIFIAAVALAERFCYFGIMAPLRRSMLYVLTS